MQFKSLRFEDPDKELRFANHRLPTLVNSLRISVMLMAFCMTFNILVLFLTMSDDSRGASNGPALLGMSMSCFCIALYIVIFLHLKGFCNSLGKVRSPEHFERLTLVAILSIILWTVFNNRFRLAHMFGLQPEQVWDLEDCGRMTESLTFLILTMVVALAGMFLPIRSNLLPLVPAFAVLSFVVVIILFGSPEAPVKSVVNVILLSIMGVLTVVSSRQNEMRERERFSEITEVRNEMIIHKVARFDLEHQLEQPNVQTSSVSSLSTRIGRQSSSHVDERSLSEAELTGVTINLSESEFAVSSVRSEQTSELDASDSGHAKARPEYTVKSSQSAGKVTTQIKNHNPCTETSAQTDVTWSIDCGFKCHRCSLPPTPYTTADARDRTWRALNRLELGCQRIM
eukprot:gnl/MRDRNA2_/MRDRNA2_194414_c0_seq1.p1 gnl/MRDRNA2_/MRDRNA2_194414_c0~~gnl/MRDRNA2_/MRDRNA2_194414_c0_seq1.p1  ORF type:complete len:399 (-),score=42.84 gnl/MRDRNA2_/MRDRNA2_194414_c0_seq1:76-1272(-)